MLIEYGIKYLKCKFCFGNMKFNFWIVLHYIILHYVAQLVSPTCCAYFLDIITYLTCTILGVLHPIGRTSPRHNRIHNPALTMYLALQWREKQYGIHLSSSRNLHGQDDRLCENERYMHERNVCVCRCCMHA